MRAQQENDGLWYARQQRPNGVVCVGFAPQAGDAIRYCEELLIERHAHEQANAEENAQPQPN